MHSRNPSISDGVGLPSVRDSVIRSSCGGTYFDGTSMLQPQNCTECDATMMCIAVNAANRVTYDLKQSKAIVGHLSVYLVVGSEWNVGTLDANLACT